ncbi:MAG: alpha-1,2-fucosyltransferase [Sideroxydans sp.]|jgi:hypothetical protein
MSQSTKQEPEIVVTFTGGLGAQILSAAVYFDLLEQGQNICADVSYFKQAARTATVGNKGELSYWNYELGQYDLPVTTFPTSKHKKSIFKRNGPRVITDGVDKLRLAIAALRKPKVRKHFPISISMLEECRKITGNNDCLCIHIRRGDYVNVASHLVGDMDFVYMARSLSKFVPAVVVISDSEVAEEIKKNLNELFEHCSFVVGGNPHVAHALMRQAKYLICSNSQFSLSAALLNEVGQQVFLPTKWFGESESDSQIPINEICRFQMLSLS